MEICVTGRQTIAGLEKPMPASDEERYMLRALELAELGRGTTGPNPLVGAVMISGNEVIGEGYHEVLGGPHAEVNAIAQSGSRAKGSSLYVTLEPCAHYGRTPPCADLIIDAGIRRVIIAMRDPNPLVNGRGEQFLKDSGVEVLPGPYAEIARRQNEAYIKRITTGMPFVTLKIAASLDGKTATRTGDSRWISGDDSRRDVHLMRSASDAVMVGIGTVLADDPLLTARTGEGRDRPPLRVVVDSEARTPPDSRIADVREAPTMVAVTGDALQERVVSLEDAGVEVVRAGTDGRVDLRLLLGLLGSREITSLMVEGGGELAAGLWEQELVDRLVFYFAPRVIGGREAPGMLGGDGVAKVDQSWQVSIDSVTASGPDIRVVAYPKREG